MAIHCTANSGQALTAESPGPFTGANPFMKPKGVKCQMTLVDAVKKMKCKKTKANDERKAPGIV